MLILTRRIEQTLMIGDTVTITVLRVRGDRVQLGVNAPSDVRVRRNEKMDQATEMTPVQDATP